jgi:hypothetical protein
MSCSSRRTWLGFGAILVGAVLVVGEGVGPWGAARAEARGPAAAAAMTQETPPPSDVEPLHRPFDQILDLYVRDGFVYYRALKSDRSRFDRYIASLDVSTAAYEAWSREQKIAYWINAYNAFVLKTIIDSYPIRGGAKEFPVNSIRQIPGAFEKLPHRAAGRTVTLDEIDKVILAELKEPRALLALGRGSIGGGRLHSEAYTAAHLDEQLMKVQSECVTRKECVTIDTTQGTLAVTPLFGWREPQFTGTLGQQELATHPGRTPLERAILRLITPHVLPMEREFLAQNKFKLTYQPYDWRLNDLTGGMPDR